MGDRVAELAREHRAIIVLENLNHLRDNANGSRSFNKALSLWFYRRLQFTIAYEALERGLVVEYINPSKTSSRCPRCGGKLKDADRWRTMKCRTCGLVGDRDVVACVNLFLRYSRCGVPGVAPNAPEGDENPRPMRGNQG